MSEQETIIPISFALTARMQSFIELRDALRCMQQAYHTNAPYAWLPASKELHDLLVGDSGKKPAMPHIVGLFAAMQKHFKELASKHPQFEEKLHQACTDIDQHEDNVRRDTPLAIDFLCTDAWLNAYYDAIRKQDLLGQKQSLPQIIDHIWLGKGKHAQRLHNIMVSLCQAIDYLDDMLHAHVPWQARMAKSGSDQITLEKHDDIGLLIVGMPESLVQDGILPTYSGNRQLVRLRFSQWLPGQPVQNIQQDFNYSVMMVPIS